MKRIMIIAGGTGGHIFPALAVADELKRQGIEVCWLGARYGLEAKIVGDRYPMKLVDVKGFRRRGWLAKLLSPWQVLKAIIRAYRIFADIQPDAVLTMGGYVAAPGGVAAWLHRLPLIMHEQNAKAGLTNRCLVRIAKVRLQAFTDAFTCKKTIMTVGNPVRRDLMELPSPAERLAEHQGLLRVLIVGGSQGARALNESVCELWSKSGWGDQVSVWHQTGQLDYVNINAIYQGLSVQAKVEPFIDDVAKAYAWADIVICRAGAMTISELAAVGAASVLVPYPSAVDDHQYYNARYLSKQGAAILLDQKQLSAEKLGSLLSRFIDDKQSLLKMAQSAKNLAYMDATERVAKACINVPQRKEKIETN